MNHSSRERALHAEAWSPARKYLATGLLVFHLSAVIVAPLTMDGAYGALFSPVQFLRQYATALYLDHGYRFFAPDPGPTHTIRFEHAAADGPVIEGSLPDRLQTQPRLRYHRWFMLGESLANEVAQTLANLTAYTEDQRQMQKDIADLRAQGRVREAGQLQVIHAENQREFERHWEMAKTLSAALKQHLAKQFPGQTIRVYSRRQLIPSPADIRLGQPMTHADLQQEIELTDPQATLNAALPEELTPPGDSR